MVSFTVFMKQVFKTLSIASSYCHGNNDGYRELWLRVNEQQRGLPSLGYLPCSLSQNGTQ